MAGQVPRVWLGLTYEPAQPILSRNEHHIVGGNPMRFDRTSLICPDVEWQRKLGIAEGVVISAVTLPVRQPQIVRLITRHGATAGRQPSLTSPSAAYATKPNRLSGAL
jgi:hypothetical protein